MHVLARGRAARTRAATADGRRPASPPPFNVNTISQGVSTADFYLARADRGRPVPRDRIRRRRLIAKPQLRGAEGTKLTLNLGDEIPVLSTVFGAAAAGGFASRPSVVVQLPVRRRQSRDDAPRDVRGEIILELSCRKQHARPDHQRRRVRTCRRSARGRSRRSFGCAKGSRSCSPGLLRDDERKVLRGFPGLLRMPSSSSCSRTTTGHRPDRHRHAPDAAYREDARADGRVTWRRSISARSRTSGSADRRRSSRRRRTKPRRGHAAGDAIADTGRLTLRGCPGHPLRLLQERSP